LLLDGQQQLGPVLFGCLSLVNHLLLGWPLYLLFGVASGSDYGSPTSHFWLGKPFQNGRRLLFPDSFGPSMRLSNLGVVGMLAILALAAMASSPARVLCVYGLPYLVINAWLVGYTWLQHTDLGIPHFTSGEWTWS
jgi:omega-6 fatty acid desaturase (delta-12 desaturase)